MAERTHYALLKTQLEASKASAGSRRLLGNTAQVARMALEMDTEIVDEVRGFEDTRLDFWDAFNSAFRWIQQFREYPKTRARYLSALKSSDHNIDELRRAWLSLRDRPGEALWVDLHPQASTASDPLQVSGYRIDGGNHGPPEKKQMNSELAVRSRLILELLRRERLIYRLEAEEMGQAIRYSRLKLLRMDFDGNALKLSQEAKQLTFEQVAEDPELARKKLSVDEARHWIALRVARLMDENGTLKNLKVKEAGDSRALSDPQAIFLHMSDKLAVVERLRMNAAVFSATPLKVFTVWPAQLFLTTWRGLTRVGKWIDEVGWPLKIPAVVLTLVLFGRTVSIIREELTMSESDRMWQQVREIAQSESDPERVADRLSRIIEKDNSNIAYQIALAYLAGELKDFNYNPNFQIDGKSVDPFFFRVAQENVWPILDAVYNGTEEAPDGKPIYGIKNSLEGRQEAKNKLEGLIKKAH